MYARPTLVGCYANNTTIPLFAKAHPITTMSTALLMFVMSTYRCLRSLLEVGHWQAMPLMTLFLRDGIFSFLGVSVVTTAQVIMYHTAKHTLANLLAMPALAVYCVISSRVLLGMKAAVMQDEVDDSSPTRMNGLPTFRVAPHTGVCSSGIST
ncbi:hypothetical protein BDQ12DRAFT_405310 [Crucibulum laeve]|uniref:Uncharacterized protein n=1 Tax=Crucibulum laeve TaxID=68775 RepID=A0A5C3LNS5_9AGAR|nr:hypothetical protein BDQ12DRAFT_405310 [Crucibulum laeve]